MIVLRSKLFAKKKLDFQYNDEIIEDYPKGLTEEERKELIKQKEKSENSKEIDRIVRKLNGTLPDNSENTITALGLHKKN